MARRSNPELEALRRESDQALRELAEADDSDEVSGVIAEAAAQAAARTVRQITIPDSDPPARKKHGPAAVAAALVTLGAAAAALLEALRQAGWIH